MNEYYIEWETDYCEEGGNEYRWSQIIMANNIEEALNKAKVSKKTKACLCSISVKQDNKWVTAEI